jgi:hypothetical protein
MPPVFSQPNNVGQRRRAGKRVFATVLAIFDSGVRFAVLSVRIVTSREDFPGARNLFRFPSRMCFKVGLHALA